MAESEGSVSQSGALEIVSATPSHERPGRRDLFAHLFRIWTDEQWSSSGSGGGRQKGREEGEMLPDGWHVGFWSVGRRLRVIGMTRGP